MVAEAWHIFFLLLWVLSCIQAVFILPAGANDLRCLQKGTIVLILITKCLFKFVLTVHIFILRKKCALVLLKSSIVCHGNFAMVR